MTIKSTDFRALSLWAAILPLATFNVSYLIAAGLEHVPACIPYIEGCTSVSSTGRHLPESLIVKAGLLPSAAILLLFWYRCAAFLQLGGRGSSWVAAMRVIGTLVAISLIVYGVTLGLKEPLYRDIRRIAIDGFALSNFASQLLFVIAYRPVRIAATRTLFRWLVVLCLALPALGIISEVAKILGAPRHAANNIIAWNAAVLLCAFLITVGQLWHRHGFSGQLSIKSDGRAASPSE